MKNVFIVLILVSIFCSCKKNILQDISVSQNLSPFKNTIEIDSVYTYPGDELYKSILMGYNRDTQNLLKQSSRNLRANLSIEDEMFFNRRDTVLATEAVIYLSRANIYPGAVLEGNSISNARYRPIVVPNRNPIKVSATLTHNIPKSTVGTITTPSTSATNDYVNKMVKGGSFSQNEKFMFSYNRFSFYDEIKHAFGSDVNTRGLFSEKSETSSSERHKIAKSTGMYVKFFQSSFTITVDNNAISSEPIVGTSGVNPVYVNSVTYGRMGILVLETDTTFDFANSTLTKSFRKIFSNGSETYTKDEESFLNQTNFKLLIIGGDSDYTVKPFTGYNEFIKMISKSTFSEQAYGTPVACTFADANTHEVIETKFVNNIVIEPLFVHLRVENVENKTESNGDFYIKDNVYLAFFSDREKNKPARAALDLTFEIDCKKSTWQMMTNMDTWPLIQNTRNVETTTDKVKNIDFATERFLFQSIQSRSTIGIQPTPEMTHPNPFSRNMVETKYSIKPSPFFKII